MKFVRKVQRSKKKTSFLSVSVLNAPNKRMEVPQTYRDNLLRHYGLSAGNLTNKDAFHIVFVLEGVVFGMLTRTPDQGVRVTLHILEMDSSENVNLVGAEIYKFWEELKEVITFEELRLRYTAMAGSLGLTDVTDAN